MQVWKILNNIKSGFSATGIYPFNKQKVLNEVPTLSEDLNNVTSVVSV